MTSRKPLRAIVTGHHGPLHGAMAEITKPRVEKYAEAHDAFLWSIGMDDGNHYPPSWYKIPYLMDVLQDFDEVLWVDADIFIVNPLDERNIFDELTPGAWQGMTYHRSNESGEVPNCGVWLLRGSMLHVLWKVWSIGLSERLDHPWWEQAAMLDQMGYTLTFRKETGAFSELIDVNEPKGKELREHTARIDVKWNDHPSSVDRASTPLWYHVTNYPDRLALLREMQQRHPL